jgi:hypothetical protein
MPKRQRMFLDPRGSANKAVIPCVGLGRRKPPYVQSLAGVTASLRQSDELIFEPIEIGNQVEIGHRLLLELHRDQRRGH